MLKFEKKIPLLLLFLLIPFSTLLFSCDTLMDDLDSVAEAVLAEEAKNNYVNYTVNHLLQNIEDDEYTILESTTQQGQVGKNTQAIANEYEGFTVLPFEQKSIASDGTTIIEIYYDRNIHTITYTDGLDQIEIQVPESTAHKFGTSVYLNFTDIGSLEHFEFTGWKDFSSGITYSASSNPYIVIPDKDTTLEAQWETTLFSYSIVHKIQDLNASTYTEYHSQTFYGDKNTETAAVALSIEGFTAQPINQQIIAEDGSTVVEVFYNRNLHTITYSDDYTSVPESTTHKYGESVLLNFTDIGSREHFEFTGWKDLSDGIIYSESSNPSISVRDEDITLLAQWKTTLYSYSVVHKTQDLNASTYTEYQTQTFYGDKNTETAAVALSIEGFTAQPISQQIISEDGTTVVEVLYDRNNYTITYDDNVATETIAVPSAVTLAYEDTCNVNFTDIGSRLGYTFNGWNTKADGSGQAYQSENVTSFTVDANNVTLYAQWLATTANGITISVPTYSDNSGTLTLTSEITGLIDAGHTSTATFTVTTTAGYNNFYWFVDGESVQTGSTTTFIITTNNYSAGNHTLLLYAEDSSGNSATAETTFTIVK
ncbi:MAG: InlB B-repeat-containing protein [Treponema sp.]|nr:InlB B-repeat-containing protein [Treponema sp.]